MQRQIVGEVMVTATLGLIVGFLLAIQVPLIGPFAFVPYGVVLPAMLLSSILILDPGRDLRALPRLVRHSDPSGGGVTLRVSP